MCTAITFKANDHYFGRNLDLEYNYNEEVVITPRNYKFKFRLQPEMKQTFAIIGIATVSNNYPLYYDATNEYGLSMAALNFPGNAVYQEPDANKVNIAPFEFIPWTLGQCRTVKEVQGLLDGTNLVNIPFSKEYPLSPLHFMISDKNKSITVEPVKNGLIIYDNPIGVLTNNPPFEYHMHNLCNYLNLTSEEPINRFSDAIKITPYSRGMGAIGLPGDLSSSSRFIRAAFTKFNALSGATENESVNQFFHILGSVVQQEGCVKVNGKYEKTVYSSCCNTDRCIYYYKSYENSQVSSVCLYRENLEKSELIRYPLIYEQHFFNMN